MSNTEQHHSGSGDNVGRDKNTFINIPRWVLYFILLLGIILGSYYTIELYKNRTIFEEQEVLNEETKPIYQPANIDNKDQIIHRFMGKKPFAAIDVIQDGTPTIIAIFETVDKEDDDFPFVENLDFVNLQKIGERWQEMGSNNIDVSWGGKECYYYDSLEIRLEVLEEKPYIYFYKKFIHGGSGGHWGSLYFILYDIIANEIKGIIYDGREVETIEYISNDMLLEGEFLSVIKNSSGTNLPLSDFKGSKSELSFLLDKAAGNSTIYHPDEKEFDISKPANFWQKWLYDNADYHNQVEFTFYGQNLFDHMDLTEYHDTINTEKFTIVSDPPTTVVVYDKEKRKYFCLFANEISANRHNSLNAFSYGDGFLVVRGWNEIDFALFVAYPSGKTRPPTDEELTFVKHIDGREISGEINI